MSSGLSYPSLKCVLEHVEANKRIYLASRSPTVQRFEKTIPLRLDFLRLNGLEIQINDITYATDTIFFANFKGVGFINEKTGYRYKGVAPKKLNSGDRCCKMSSRLFEGRNSIQVGQLQTKMYRQTKNVPEDFKIYTKNVLTTFDIKEDDISLIDPGCFPLEKLQMSVIRNSKTFNLPAVKTAKKLVLIAIQKEEFVKFYSILENDVAVFPRLESDDSVLNLVESWVKNQQTSGIRFFETAGKKDNKKLLDKVMQKFGGKHVELEVPDKRMVPSSKCIRITTSSTSSLLFYGSFIEKSDRRIYLKMKAESHII
ncbi:hypothetical protein GCK72_007716 [Caenorhabditis remanei]|uniref:F-box associated domain-containing protein n=1 Tax=Caenorhabditis remanei TaxID=31234 RepID=A0A6A5HN42_CAERE|nr:hypothetical protein GCK72_007716 [Caenorhabditis remanei]KAF1767757.1 hypothetical protein GCK72_007716 [Caenorhabditis remanei]